MGNNEKKQNTLNNPLYSQAHFNSDIKKIVKHVNKERKENSAEEIREKQKRTLIVKQYMDKNITNSEDVRKPIYEEYPGTVIRNGLTTPGGSILLELDDEKTAQAIIKKWNNKLYGGNKGVMLGNIPKTKGIVKHVWNNRSEEEI